MLQTQPRRDAGAHVRVVREERERTNEELTRRQEELAFLATHDHLTGPAEPHADPRSRRADARSRARRRRRRWRRCSSTSTTSRASTTRSGTGSATSCCARSRRGSTASCAIPTRLGVSAATSSCVHRRGDLARGRPGADRRAPAGSAQGAVHCSWARGRSVTVTASIGIASGERACADELLRDADIAMYRAKWDGQEPLRDVRVRACRTWSSAHGAGDGPARARSSSDEFFLVYQPTFDLRDMHPTGVEALIRWQQPRRAGSCSRTTSSRCSRRPA